MWKIKIYKNREVEEWTKKIIKQYKNSQNRWNGDKYVND